MSWVERFRVTAGSKVDLGEHDAADTGGIERKKDATKQLKANVDRLADLQYLLYAENKRSLLIVLQAMDAGGKDGTIRHVMGPINPQGCHVTSFKAPTDEELAHDFLWRIHKAAPRKGQIGIFNRSHYEDVLVVRVRQLVAAKVWRGRYARINEFEKQLADGGTHILKFFLHVGKDEQLKRFRKRLEDPRKHWKFNPDDLKVREQWGDYMAAYEDALTKCSTSHAPWFVIPADHKWFRNLAVGSIIRETLEGLDMAYPKPEFDPKDFSLS